MHEDRTSLTLEPLHLERIVVIYRGGRVWVEHMDGQTFGPFESIVDAVEAGVA